MTHNERLGTSGKSTRVAGLDPGSSAFPVSQRGDLPLRATQSRGRRIEPGVAEVDASAPGAADRCHDGGPAASLQLALDGVAA